MANPTTTTNMKREPGSGGMLLTNGGSTGGAALSTKLSSLKPARDMTLGGRAGALGAAAAAAKKVYMPNLNVERKKNAPVKTSKDTTARGGRGARGARGERGARGGGRGAGRGAATLIQTQGVFSEGAGAVNIRKTSATNSSYSRNADDAVSAMRKPTLVKNELKKIDLKAEATQVRELLGDSEDDELMDDKTELEQIPIKLNEAKWKYIKTDIKVETPLTNGDVSSANAVANDDEDAALAVAQKLQSMAVQQVQKLQEQITALPRYPQSVEELLKSTQQQMFIMQLPDTLPCEDDEADASDSPEKTAEKNTNAESASTSAAAALSNSPASKSRLRKPPSLKRMEEGQVGKLLRYKSGKIKLLLGTTQFDLDMGMETGFLQDLMSISTNRDERSGNMINLGPIQAKLTATPDWEQLLKQQLMQERA